MPLWALHRASGEGGCPPIDDETGSRRRVGPRHLRWRTAVEHYVGIDVSLELSSVCVVDGRGKVVKEAKVASEPEALVCFFKKLGVPLNRIGLEAGPLSQWLHAGLTQAGFETVLLETRHVKAALSAMTVKTDRKDACGLAQLLRMGWFQQVHAKSIGSQEIRALLVARKQLLGRLLDVELSIRGILRGFGLKVGQVTRKTFEARIWELVTGHATLERIAEAMLSARATLQAEYEKLHKALYEAANVLLSRITRFSKLKRWGMDVAKRRGSKRAKVALARKIGVILHRMWIDGTTYRWTEADRSAGLIKEEYETQAGRTEAPTARSPVAGTVELVKPLHGQWPSSDEPRVSR